MSPRGGERDRNDGGQRNDYRAQAEGDGGLAQDVPVFYRPGNPDVVIKVAHLAVNDPSKLVGIVPELLPNKEWYV
jgi:hypothetical protein